MQNKKIAAKWSLSSVTLKNYSTANPCMFLSECSNSKLILESINTRSDEVIILSFDIAEHEYDMN